MKDMKKLITSVLIAVAVASMSSCTDFLQPKSENSYSQDNYFTNDKQAIDAVDACYYQFLEEGFMGREWMWPQGAANDFVWGRTRSGYPELATLSYTNGNQSPLKDAYKRMVQIIARSNWVVESLLNKQKGTELTDIEKRSLGEAYFCRALAHFYFAYRYGTDKQGVPFVKYESFEGGYNNEIPKQNESVMKDYEMIIEDFDAAEALLPKCEEYGDADFGRAHKAACEGYKAKTYAYWACWDKSKYADVITCVNKMEQEYGRSIEGVDFTTCFSSDYAKWRNTEYVWSIPSEGGPKGVYGGIEFPGVSFDNGLYGFFNTWGQFKPSLDIYNELKKDDEHIADAELGNVRLKNSLCEYGDKLKLWGQTDFHYYSAHVDVEVGFMITKYVDPFSYGEGYYEYRGDDKAIQAWGDSLFTLEYDEAEEWYKMKKQNGEYITGEWAPDSVVNNKSWVVTKSAIELGYVGDNSNWPVCRMNFPLLRFADCILLRAEAYLATGNAGAAKTDIDKIRVRANLKPLAANPTWADLYHERRVELAFEHSDHLYDLRRWAVSGDAVIKNLAIAELEKHPDVRHYTKPSVAGEYVNRVWVPNTDFTVGPYLDYQSPAKKWADYKIVYPYPTDEIAKANGALKQNEGFN